MAINQLKEDWDCESYYQKALQRYESFLEVNGNNR